MRVDLITLVFNLELLKSQLFIILANLLNEMSRENLKIERQLAKREADANKRTLHITQNGLVDFSSNDYLGLARSQVLKNEILKSYAEVNSPNGSTGSRLLTGNSALAQEVEAELASFFHFPAGLIFNSGYSANLGFFSSVPQRGDTILYDELSHACIKDGCRLSLAKSFAFKHNNMADLDRKLMRAEGNIYIACEAIYSMDGDKALLSEICDLAERFHAKVIVDEAHSTGIYGKQGDGLVAELNLSNKVYACIFTFGKAMGIHGAFVASSKSVVEYMVNFSRPFIYTTAPSAFEFISIQQSLRFLSQHTEQLISLKKNIGYFSSCLTIKQPERYQSTSPIKVVIVNGNEKAKIVSDQIKAKGFDVRAILSPTVREGEERLRVCIHSFNTQNEIRGLAEALNSILS